MIEHALVVLRARQRDRSLAVAQREEADLAAGEIFLDHDLGPGRAEAAFEHHGDRGLGFRKCLGDHHALAGGKAIRLDHHRRALLAHVRERIGGGVEALIRTGRNVEIAAEILGETLGAFELRSLACQARTP